MSILLGERERAHLVVQLRLFFYNNIFIYYYIRVVNLLRASFSPIFKYFSAVNVTRGVSFSPIFLTCMPDMPCMMWSLLEEYPSMSSPPRGYFSCAFPTLFPTGAGDFSGQRQNQVTIGNYFKHLMMYDDNRFAKQPRFRFFAFNTEMRWRALQTGRVYVKQHPGDAQLSLDELRVMVGRGTDHLQLCVHSIREYQNFPNSFLLFTKVSMHLSINHSLCSVVHNYDSLCRCSSRSPIMLSILLVLHITSYQ